MIFKSGRKASPLTSLLDIILLVLFAQMILTSQLTSNEANKKIEEAEKQFIKSKNEIVTDYEDQINKFKKDKESMENEIDSLNKKLSSANDDIDFLSKKRNELASLTENLKMENSKLASETLFIEKFKEEKVLFDTEKTKFDNDKNIFEQEKIQVKALNEKLEKENKKIEEDKIENTKLKINLENQIDLLKRAFSENERSFTENGINNISDISVRKILSSSKALFSLKTILPIVEVIVTDKYIVLKQYDNKEIINYPEDIENFIDEDRRDSSAIRRECKNIEKAIKKLCEKNGTNTNKPDILIVPSMSKDLNINYSEYYNLLFNDNSSKIAEDFIRTIHVPSDPIVLDKEIIDED